MASPNSSPEPWLEAHAEALYRYAVTRLRRPDQAEDAVQETLLAALRSRRDFRGDSSERTWLTGILKYKIVDQIRDAERDERMVEFDASDQFFAANGRWRRRPGKFTFATPDLLENDEFWQQVTHCLEALPTRQSRAFTLFSLEEKNSDQVCKQLGVSATNLWVLLHRARLRMRECLERYWFRVGDDRR